MNIKKLTKTVSSVFLLGASVLATGCQKDFDGVITLMTESFVDDGTKLAVDGTHSTWVNGDEIRINSGVYAVSVNGSNEASISGVPGADAFYAVYPGSLAGNLTSTSATLNLPNTYQYRTDNSGKQIIELPMVGYLDPNVSEGPLYLKHATGALVIRVSNPTGENGSAELPMYIDTIVVTSNNYKISGSRTVDVSNPSSTAESTSNSDEKRVMILFEQQNLVLPVSGHADVMLPIAPVGSGNRFTVKVVGHTRLNRYTFTRTQSESHGGAMTRSQVGYAEVEVRKSGYCTTSSVLDKDGSTYLIKKASDYLFLVEACKNNWTNDGAYSSKSYRLVNDIDLAGYVTEPLIGFTGSFNGNGYTISNLTIESDYTINNTGRVAMIATATTNNVVTGLTLNNVSITYTGTASGVVYMAGLVAFDASSSNYSNCRVNGITLTHNGTRNGTTYVGGMIAKVNTYDKTFSNCNVSNLVWGNGSATQFPVGVYIGGFVSSSSKVLSFEACNYSATEPLSFYANQTRWGALVGETSSNVNVVNCNLQSNVSLIRSSTVFAGGMIGRASSSITVQLVTVGDPNIVRGSIYARGGTYNVDSICGNASSATVNGTYTNNLTISTH